jgi:hypothetical protein
MSKYRQLALLTAWIDFQYVHASVKASGMAAAARRAYDKRLIFDWLNKIMKGKGLSDGLNIDTPGDVEKAMTIILRSSPRLRAMLPIIAEHVLELQEKGIVWVLFPAQQIFVAAALILAGIDCRVFHAGLTSMERANLVKEFNESKNTAMVLVCSYLVNSAGLNLQCVETSISLIPQRLKLWHSKQLEDAGVFDRLR